MSTKELIMTGTALSVRNAIKSLRNSQVLRSMKEFMISKGLFPVRLKDAMKLLLRNQIS